MEIPTGPRVDIYIHAIHHNPQVWKNPEVPVTYLIIYMVVGKVRLYDRRHCVQN
jgi:hypothetical protein